MAFWTKPPIGSTAEASNPRTDRPTVPIGAVDAVASVTRSDPTTATQPQQLNAENPPNRAADSAQMLLSFGKIVSVLMRSPQFRRMPLAELEVVVLPAVRTGQFLIVEARSKVDGSVNPVAAALWACVSPDVDFRMAQKLDKPRRLKPAEWKSGNIPWLIASAGDARLINPALTQLQHTTFKDQPIKMIVKRSDGSMMVGSFSPTSGQPIHSV